MKEDNSMCAKRIDPSSIDIDHLRQEFEKFRAGLGDAADKLGDNAHTALDQITEYLNGGSLSSIDTMCGTGPFKYSESVVDNHITLVKNEDYWKENAPKLDGITFYLLCDESARLAALRTGDINLCSLSAMNLADVERDANIKVISYQSNDYTYLGFNLSSEKLQDKRVSQAMSLAVDRDMIIDYVYNGEATVSTFVAPAMGN